MRNFAKPKNLRPRKRNKSLRELPRSRGRKDFKIYKSRSNNIMRTITMKIEFGSIAMTVNVDSTRTKLTIVAHRPNAKDTLSAKSATN